MPNRVHFATRDRIESEADPVGFLIRVVRGEALDDERPTLDQRMNAARLLAGKIVPDMRAVEISVEDPGDRPMSELSDGELEAVLANEAPAQLREAVA